MNDTCNLPNVGYLGINSNESNNNSNNIPTAHLPQNNEQIISTYHKDSSNDSHTVIRGISEPQSLVLLLLFFVFLFFFLILKYKKQPNQQKTKKNNKNNKN